MTTDTEPQAEDRIESLIEEGVASEEPLAARDPDPFWQGLQAAGTELWLDTGDMDAASELWAAEFTALTTNNTLLNNEVQKGIYDGLIQSASEALSDLDPQSRIIEIAFILNARHGLRLARRFGGKVSVELHTDLSHDLERTLKYARRFYRLCPEQFIIKIPLTPSGLIATRQVREEGIPVNFTLGFSARQNVVATAFSKPNYVNVFLGRLGAVVADNELGDADNIGEKATLSSNRLIAQLSDGRAEPTRQIAASLRESGQLADLAGVDVYTMPTKVAAGAKDACTEPFTNQRDIDPEVSHGDLGRLHTIWEASEAEHAFAAGLDADPPATAAELVDRAHTEGVGDMFPRWSQDDLERISDEGKIPKYASWADRVEAGELALDTLLNAAGLASFTLDQKALDDRIASLI